MGNDLDIRLKADRAFVKYLCAATGKSASALAVGAGVAATTLNRFVSRKAKLASTLKDSTIQKIAKRWGLDYPALAAYRRDIEEALREGIAVPVFGDERRLIPSGFRSGIKSGGMKEPAARTIDTPTRDPLMDQIMGATYDVWFNTGYRDAVAFERLPDLVRLLYGRVRAEAKAPASREIKKRAADMLSVAAMDTAKRK